MMEKTIRDFCACAVYAKDAGFDGILIHGGHGWLFSQFFSPLENTRTDEYGGSLENRFRFPLEILRAVRAAVGEDFVIELRISGSDRWPGGTSAEDMAEFSTHLSGLVDILHVSSGHYYRSYRTLEFSSLYTRHNCNVDLAAVIRKKCPRDVKLGVIGGINSPENADKLIANDIVDFIIVGRQAFADPEFMNKVAAGRADDVNRCVRCMRCYSGSHEHEKELEYLEKYHLTKEMELAQDAYGKGKELGKKVVVLGGGMVGAETAIELAEEGCSVTIVEMAERLILEARNMAFTCVMDKLDELGICSYVNTICGEVTENGVKVEGEDGEVFEIPADGVVCALGLKSLSRVTEKLRSAARDGVKVVELGDCHAVDRIGDANLDGYIEANMIV